MECKLDIDRSSQYKLKCQYRIYCNRQVIFPDVHAVPLVCVILCIKDDHGKGYQFLLKIPHRNNRYALNAHFLRQHIQLRTHTLWPFAAYTCDDLCQNVETDHLH